MSICLIMYTIADTILTFRLFIVTSATKGGWLPPPLRFCVRFKILYRVIQPLIQHCLLHKMACLNIIYVIATRNYEFFTTGIFSVINELLRYSTVTTFWLNKYKTASYCIV